MSKLGKILDLAHCDLARPIDSIAKEGFKYSISFVDDYLGLIIVYFLKNKNDSIKALEIFLLIWLLMLGQNV